MLNVFPAIAGRAYFTPGSYLTKLTVADTAYAVPFIAPVNFSFDQIGVNVTTAGVGANADVRLAIYHDDAGRPGKLYNDFGAITGLTSTGGKTISVTGNNGRPMLWAGHLYWLVSAWDGAGTDNPVVAALATAVVPQAVAAGLGVASIANLPSSAATAAVGLSGSHTYGALPDDGTDITWSVVLNGAVPLVGLRAA
jgi:hypothetical protein